MVLGEVVWRVRPAPIARGEPGGKRQGEPSRRSTSSVMGLHHDVDQHHVAGERGGRGVRYVHGVSGVKTGISRVENVGQ